MDLYEPNDKKSKKRRKTVNIDLFKLNDALEQGLVLPKRSSLTIKKGADRSVSALNEFSLSSLSRERASEGHRSLFSGTRAPFLFSGGALSGSQNTSSSASTNLFGSTIHKVKSSDRVSQPPEQLFRRWTWASDGNPKAVRVRSPFANEQFSSSVDNNSERGGASFRGRQSAAYGEMSLNELANFLPEILFEQDISRYVQSLIVRYRPSDITLLSFLSRLIEHGKEVMTNIFGNYIFQVFLDFRDPGIDIFLFEKLFKGNVPAFCENQFSCRVLQKALSTLNFDTAKSLVHELSGNVVDITTSEFGNHVMQKIFQHPRLRPKHYRFILDEFIDRVEEVSKNNYGCRVFQVLIENHGKDPELMDLYKATANKIMDLVEHPTATFIIQKIVKLRIEDVNSIMADRMTGHIVDLSCSQYASNTLEMFFQHKSKSGTRAICRELTSDEQVFLKVLDGKYSNYVIQRILKTPGVKCKKRVVSIMKKNRDVIVKMESGKYVYFKYIEKRANRFNYGQNGKSGKKRVLRR